MLVVVLMGLFVYKSANIFMVHGHIKGKVLSSLHYLCYKDHLNIDFYLNQLAKYRFHKVRHLASARMLRHELMLFPGCNCDSTR